MTRPVRRLAATLTTLIGLMAATSALHAQTAPAAAAPGKPSITDLFRDPQMVRPVLSPDGKYFATVITRQGETGVLAIVELDNPRNLKVVAGFADAGIGDYKWVTNDRLVYSAGSTEAGNVRDLHGSGLWSVKRDGSDQRLLIHPRWGQRGETGTRMSDRTLDPEWGLFSVPQDGSNEVLVGLARFNAKQEVTNVRLARLDVETGMRRFVDEGAPRNAKGWAVDVLGQPWALQTQRENDVITYVKNAQGEWTVLSQGTVTEPPVAPDVSDGQGLRLVAFRNERGEDSLYRMDPATLKIESQPLISAAGYDIEASLVYDRGSKRMLGLNFDTDAPGSVWFDPKLKGWQARVDKQLGGRVNLLQCGACLTNSRLLVTSMSDTQPPEYFIYDGATDKLQFLGGSRPWLKAEEMGRRDLVRIKARDGLEFPVMVTMPPGKASGPRPAVMLVHGGPNVRGTDWTWNPVSQFFATRGYVVIEPEFRGSEGYGLKLARAGWKQWGLTMQDDVSDALQWAVKKGWVDPQRVCIAGASYGGYATLMGMIKDPAQYKCGISWVGVTDLNYLFDIHWSDTSDDAKKYGLTETVGDPVKDAAQFNATSPLKRAAELKQPLLLAYGATDVRVPLKHGTAFRSAVEAAGNKNVEWVVYADEGHGWRKLSSNEDFYGRAERFLAKNIGTAPSPAPTAAGTAPAAPTAP